MLSSQARVWCSVVWCGAECYGHGMERVSHHMVCFGVVWYGAVGYDMEGVLHPMEQQIQASNITTLIKTWHEIPWKIRYDW